MIVDKKIERQDQSKVKLSVTVSKDHAKQEYQNLLHEYAKKAQIKGFRPGKVPPQVLEKKFGESLRAEAMQKILESSLGTVFEEIEERPLPYAQPELDDAPELQFDSDLSFSVVYDVYPEFEIGDYKGLTVESPDIVVSDEDLDRELKAIQDQNAIVMDKDDGAVEKDDIVSIDYAVLDDADNPVPGEERSDYSFTVGSGMNVFRIDEDIIGMKADETKTIEKSWPDDFEDAELAGTSKRIRVTVKSIRQRDLPEIDDELAQDVSDDYETLDDLKKDIRQRLEKTAESRSREQTVRGLLEQILTSTTVELPASMVRAELENSWRNFLGQFGGNEQQILGLLQAQGRGKEEFLEEWREGAESRLRSQLVTQKLIEKEGIEASEDEVNAYIAEQADTSSMNPEEVKEHYVKNNMLDYIRHEVQERKLFDALLAESKIKKGKKTSLMDALGRNE
ncbi:MAG: trigger factor [Spirochaetaceae bacterium]